MASYVSAETGGVAEVHCHLSHDEWSHWIEAAWLPVPILTWQTAALRRDIRRACRRACDHLGVNRWRVLSPARYCLETGTWPRAIPDALGRGPDGPVSLQEAP
jgi:hypothetical protein